MLDFNPFAALSASIPAAVMKGYVVLMAVLVAAGTLFDIVHKASAKYFFTNWSKPKRSREVGGGELAAIAAKTAVVDVLASGEFCNMKRRIAHLLTMYGFVLHIVATVAMVFGASADVWPRLWWIGGIMLLVGYRTREAALVLVPVLLGATWVHWKNGWLFTNAGGGWEYPLFLAVAAVAVALTGPGAYALSPVRYSSGSKGGARWKEAATG